MSRAKDRLRAKGIDASEVSASRIIMVPHTSLKVAPKGHALFDPRSLYPTDREMQADMVARVKAGERPNEKAFKVREEPDGMLIVDGHQRNNAILAAAEELGRELMVMVEFFVGDDKALLLARAEANDHDRFARKDAPSVLAFRVKQLTAIGATEREIADAMPKGVGPAEVEALARWGNLCADARKRFDDGAPIGLLAAVLEAPRDEQVQRLDKLIAAGVKSARGATRRTNAERDERDPWARRMSPKQAARVADDIGDAFDRLSTDIAKSVARGVIAGLRLAANEDTKSVLRDLPTPLADAIREARTAKRKAAAK